MVEEINEKEFEKLIKKKVVVVDFFAEWCMPCLMMTPILEEVAGKFKQVSFAKVNIDENSALTEKFSVMSVPTLIIFKNSKEAGRFIGSMSADVLEEKIKKLVR